MICPDCEEQVEKLTKKGICLHCYRRITQLNYLNKKNNTNDPYIPLKDLKELNPRAYNSVMGRRHSVKAKKEIEEQVKVKKTRIKINSTSEKSIEDIKIEYYGKVSKDLDKAFNEAGIDKDYINHKDLFLWVDIFISLLDTDDTTNFIMQCKKGEQVFNDMFNLYQHERENLDWNDLDSINRIGYAEKALQELRRPTKNLLDYYYSVDPIIEHLKEDKELLDLIKIAKSELEAKKRSHEHPYIVTKVESDLVEAVNTVKSTQSKSKIYDCTVWCYNLNGNPRKSLFRAKGGIHAKNEVDAKLKFKTFLTDKFASLIYSDRDIEIKEVSSKEEIDELARKSCS